MAIPSKISRFLEFFQRIPKNVWGFFFLGYGIYTVFGLQRGYQNVLRLQIYLVLLIPLYLLSRFLINLVEKSPHHFSTKAAKRLEFMNFLGLNAAQAVTQYIMMFCLPFFWMSQRSLYFILTLLLLASTMWDSWWTRLIKHRVYGNLIQLWGLLCALSFLFPFFWPDKFSYFYPALVAASIITLLPSRLSVRAVANSAVLMIICALMLLVAPSALRFPVLSVWLKKPHYALDDHGSADPSPAIKGDMIAATKIQEALHQGHSLCCVAPVIAPPRVNEHVTQEWSLRGGVIESPQLATAINGNSLQHPFYSFYCKEHFPPFEPGDILRCRLYLSGDIYLGEAVMRFSP